jgi:uncharacterized damage-inducible protein DinB
MQTAFAGTMTLESPVAQPITALVRLLDQLRDVIEQLPDSTYAEVPAGARSGSLGAHVRHCLDHSTAFLEGVSAGALSYDRRSRGTAIETRRASALARIETLASALIDLDPRVLDRPLRLDVQLDPAGAACSVISTAGRELAYVISHTVHHHATMAVLLSDRETSLPDRFGVAAATPSGLVACAR